MFLSDYKNMPFIKYDKFWIEYLSPGGAWRLRHSANIYEIPSAAADGMTASEEKYRINKHEASTP
ncbi:MAG: hypothetical protein JWP12_1329 [Bacteroidetes bacterium]|nr:hypothetical protein [Bacteroidota bacterium]